LISCGYKQEAINVKCERAMILRRLAANSKTKADRRNFYLEALTLLKSAVRLCDVLSTEIASLGSPEEVCSYLCFFSIIVRHAWRNTRTETQPFLLNCFIFIVVLPGESANRKNEC
jgi:hypothetical protein